MEDYPFQAGLEWVDIWMETRVRHTTVEAYMQRMRVVAGHMIGDQSQAEVTEYVARIETELRRRSGHGAGPTSSRSSSRSHESRPTGAHRPAAHGGSEVQAG